MDFSVLSYGADASGKQLSTAAVQAAMDACAAAGGGRVVMPAGTYLCGTLWLKSGVELHLAHGAVLQASGNIDDYNEADAYPQNFCYAAEEWVGRHLLIAHECENVAVTGTGVIDGAAQAYYAPPEKRWKYLWSDGLALSRDKVKQRPGQVLCFVECRGVTVQDITFRNTTCWCCFFHGCEEVEARGIRVYNHPTYANTDGIDIDCCRNVTVSDCIIDTGDDAIAIRASGKQLLHREAVCENVVISNCVLASSSSVFRVGVGAGVIRHVRVSGIAIHRGSTGMKIMGHCGRNYTKIEDVHFSDISAHHVAYPFQILGEENGPVRNVSIRNMTAECCASAVVECGVPGWVSDIRLENVRLTFSDADYPVTPALRAERGEHALQCRNAERLTVRDVCLDMRGVNPAFWGDAYHAENCSGKREDTEILLPEQ